MDTIHAEARYQARTASSLNLLTAAWLVLSAFLVVPDPAAMMWNNLVCGIAVGVLAVLRLGPVRDNAWPSWVNVIIACWVFLAPWVIMGNRGLDPTQNMMLNNGLTGTVMICLACWSGLATNTEPDERFYHSDAYGALER